MQQLRRISVGVLAGAVSLSMVGVAVAAPKHAVSLTGGKSPFAENISIVAGSASAVVYETGPSWQRGPAANPSLLARSASGKVRSLALGKGKTLQDFASFSLAKNILVAADGTDASVAWWNVASGAHGEKKVPGGYQFEGASSDGWLLENYTSYGIYDQVAGGSKKPKLLGVPFAKAAAKNIYEITTGSTGVAFQGLNNIVYLKWGTKTFKKLDVDLTKVDPTSCSLAADALGCAVSLTGKQYIYRIPLTGKAAVPTKLPGTAPYAQNISVSSSATAWTILNNTNATTTFYSVNTKGKGLKASKTVKLPLGYATGLATAAFGKFAVVTGTSRSHHLSIVTSAAGTPKSEITAALANVHAASITLSGNRVSYTDNQKDYNAGDVWSRSLSGSSAGKAAELISTTATSEGLSISGDVTADWESATTVGGKSHVLIKVGAKIGSVVGSLAQASGDGVLYQNADDKWDVYDTSTRSSSALDLPSGAAYPYLDGGYVLYVETDGSVWRTAIGKGATPRQLVAAPSGGYEGTSALSASGSYVAWQEYVGSALVVHYCAITSTTCTVKTASGGTQLVAATTNGVLVSSSTQPTTTTSRYTWKLQAYAGGAAKTVLTQTYADPQLYGASINSAYSPQVAVANGRVAWIDPTGGAHVGGLPF